MSILAINLLCVSLSGLFAGVVDLQTPRGFIYGDNCPSFEIKEDNAEWVVVETNMSLNLNCANPPTLTLGSTSGFFCGAGLIQITGNSFGGSATEVTITHNGLGSVEAVFDGNNFFFGYRAVAADIGNTVAITVTTDNPLGPPCVPASETYSLSLYAPPVLGGDTEVCVGFSAMVTPNTGGVWISSNPEIATVTNQGQVVGVTEGIVDLTFTETATGCIESVQFHSVTCLVIPQGFSPNDDGINDTWVIENLYAGHPDLRVKVFDRNGTLVFEVDSYDEYWDGTPNQGNVLVGQDGKVPPGVYFFMVWFDGASKPFTGSVFVSY